MRPSVPVLVERLPICLGAVDFLLAAVAVPLIFGVVAVPGLVAVVPVVDPGVVVDGAEAEVVVVALVVVSALVVVPVGGGAVTVYVIDALDVSPSSEVAVTLYVFVPGVAVSSVPKVLPAVPVTPPESAHDSTPSAYGSASMQRKFVVTDCPRA